MIKTLFLISLLLTPSLVSANTASNISAATLNRCSMAYYNADTVQEYWKVIKICEETANTIADLIPTAQQNSSIQMWTKDTLNEYLDLIEDFVYQSFAYTNTKDVCNLDMGAGRRRWAYKILERLIHNDKFKKGDITMTSRALFIEKLINDFNLNAPPTPTPQQLSDTIC